MRTLGLAAVIMAMVLLVGCDVSRGKYDSVKVGMTQEDVRDIMGDPEMEMETLWEYRGDNVTSVQVEFGSDGLVSDKEWIPKDPASSDWE